MPYVAVLSKNDYIKNLNEDFIYYFFLARYVFPNRAVILGATALFQRGFVPPGSREMCYCIHICSVLQV